MSLALPHFPPMEDGSGRHVCPACLAVVGKKERPAVHWIAAKHASEDADIEAARARARGGEKGEVMGATAEAPPRGKVEEHVRSALRRAGEKVDELTDEQRARAVGAPQDHPGLRGKALAAYVLNGQGIRQQAQDASAERDLRAQDEAASTRSTAAKAGAGKRASAYPPEVREAAKRVKELKGEHGAPGPKQHAHVRKVVAREVTGASTGVGDVTKAQVVDASGAKSLAQLTRIAVGEAPREDLKALRPLAEKMGDDAFCKGRNLAAILVAWAEQV